MSGGESHSGGSRRKDHHASHHGHKQFGKSGGGHGGLHSKLIASPMSPKMPGVSKAPTKAK
jgi:hypothetical protein